MNLTVPYLAGTSGEQLNFEAGENVLLSLGPGARFQSFLVTGPDTKTTESLAPSAANDVLEILAPRCSASGPSWPRTPRTSKPSSASV